MKKVLFIAIVVVVYLGKLNVQVFNLELQQVFITYLLR